jgi:N-acetylneuraminic acid mutarotase
MNVVYILLLTSIITGLNFGLSSSSATMSPAPQNQIWSSGSSMLTPRHEISATVLDGKIYVVGGQTEEDLTSIVEVYDPAIDRWSTLSPVPIAIDHSGLAGYDGKLYLVGGFIRDEEDRRRATDLLFIYDVAADKWEEGKPMPTARAGLTADFINGTLYAVGGSAEDNKDPTDSNEAYDTATETWTEKAPMPTKRHHVTSAVVDGKLYVIGGRETRVPSSLDSNEVYDPQNDAWLIVESMPTKRSSIAAVSLNNQIYVFGGEKEDGSFNKNEKFDPKTNTWLEETPMPTPRLGLGAAIYGNKAYVIGGKLSQPNESVTGVNEIFNPSK